MINKLKYNHNGIDKEIVFGKKNFLIGPKGGGKTTLLKLLWDLSHNRGQSKNVKEALYNHKWNINIVECTMDNNVISMDNLPVGQLFKDDDSSDFTDIVLQNDSLKVSIDSSKKFQVYRQKVVAVGLEQISKSFNKTLINLCESAVNIVKIKKELNVNPTFLTGMSKTKEFVINNFGDLVSPNTDRINKELIYMSDIVQKLEQSQKTIETLGSTNLFFKNHYQGDLEKEIKNALDSIKTLSENLDSNYKNLGNINRKVLSRMEIKAKTLINNERSNASNDDKKIIDRELFSSNIIKLFREIKNFKKLFNDFMDNQKVSFEHEQAVEGYADYKFAIKKDVELDHEQMGDILKNFLYSPTNRMDYLKWIEKTIDKEGLRNEPTEAKVIKTVDKNFGELIDLNTSLFIGDTDYTSLSLGQRSITMLLNKMDNNPESSFFVDQPEDNLDNKTIYEEIVQNRLLNKNNDMYDKQSFIVTHNANIGMLGYNPKEDVIIYADISNDGYINTNIVNNNSFGAVDILEGGNTPLQSRYDTLKESK